MQKLYKKLIKRALRKINIRTNNEVAFYENLIQNALCKIGIGSGGNVESSGEDGVFALLERLNPPYCIFDIGANKGKYLDLIMRFAKCYESHSKSGGGGTAIQIRHKSTALSLPSILFQSCKIHIKSSTHI